MAMSKTMEKYFDDLHAAEFGYKCDPGNLTKILKLYVFT